VSAINLAKICKSVLGVLLTQSDYTDKQTEPSTQSATARRLPVASNERCVSKTSCKWCGHLCVDNETFVYNSDCMDEYASKVYLLAILVMGYSPGKKTIRFDFPIITLH